MIGGPKVTPAAVERVLEDPPPFVERCYLAGYRRGKFPLEVLAGGVAADSPSVCRLTVRHVAGVAN